jgi:hypothetical protein
VLFKETIVTFFKTINDELDKYDYRKSFDFIQKGGIFSHSTDNVANSYIHLFPAEGFYTLDFVTKAFCSKYMEERFALGLKHQLTMEQLGALKESEEIRSVGVQFGRQFESHVREAFKSGVAMEFPMRDLQSDERKRVKFNATKIVTFKHVSELSYDIVKNNKSVIFVPLSQIHPAMDFITFLPELNAVVGLQITKDLTHTLVFNGTRDFDLAFQGGHHLIAFLTPVDQIYSEYTKRSVPLPKNEKTNKTRVEITDKLNCITQVVVGIDIDHLKNFITQHLNGIIAKRQEQSINKLKNVPTQT